MFYSGLLFWTAWGEDEAKVESSKMTGEGRAALVTANIVYPQALALDLANR